MFYRFSERSVYQKIFPQQRFKSHHFGGRLSKNKLKVLKFVRKLSALADWESLNVANDFFPGKMTREFPRAILYNSVDLCVVT